MTKRTLLCTCISIPMLAFSLAASAAETKGEAELGLVLVNGNSDSETINGKIKAITEYNKWRHTGTLEGTNISSNDVTSAERYLGSYKGDYKFREFDYFYGTVSYEDDRFSGYDNRASESIGYGRNIIHEDNLTLDGEIGVGARQSKIDPSNNDLILANGGDDKQSETVGRLYGNLGWKISDTSTFGEELTIEGGSDTTVSKSVTSLTTKINTTLAMKASFTAKNTSGLPSGTTIKSTDTTTTVSLVYGF